MKNVKSIYREITPIKQKTVPALPEQYTFIEQIEQRKFNYNESRKLFISPGLLSNLIRKLSMNSACCSG